MTTARVSIAMATFCGEPYLGAQLASIEAQTRHPDELVICDDGSEDATLEVLEAFATRAPFSVTVQRNVSRLGSTGNFERAVGLCDGDLIFLADQDDVWLPDKIAVQCAVFERRPELGACFSNGRVVDGEDRDLGYDLWEALWFGRAEQARVHEGRAVEVFLKHVVAAGTTLAFRSVHRDLLLPFPGLRSCHDAWIAFLIAAASEVDALDESLIRYRVHESNQIGLSRPGLLDQIELARAQLVFDEESGAANAFEYADLFFSTALERLARTDAPRPRPSRETLDRIGAKIDHSRRRATLPRNPLSRLPAVAREAVSGNYWRYAHGLKSIAQDILLR